MVPPSLGGSNSSVFHVSRIANKKKRDHTLTKVTQSLQEPDGFRMDVTLWFRHKNEAQFYVDNAGQIHGPTDQNHSTKLDSMEHNSVFVPGTKIIKESEVLSPLSPTHHDDDYGGLMQEYKTTTTPPQHHQSMSALDRSHRELDRLLFELQQGANNNVTSNSYVYNKPSTYDVSTNDVHDNNRYYRQYHSTASTSVMNSTPHYDYQLSHHGYLPPPSPYPRQQARYTTKLTREYHAKPIPMGPVTVRVDTSPLSTGQQQQQQQSSSYRVQQHEEYVSEREKMLVDELLQARHELATLKRTRSLMDADIYGGQMEHHSSTWETSSTARPRHESTQQYSSRTDFQRPGRSGVTSRERHHSTGFSRSENEFRQASSLLPKKPMRTMSSNQVFDGFSRNRLSSSHRSRPLHSESTYESRQGPQPITSYSAHQETMKQQRISHSQQYMKQQQSTSEQRFMEKPGEIFEEIETITLQPIGKGVQDLEPTQTNQGTVPRTPRVTTPLGRAATPRSQSGFSTMPVQRSSGFQQQTQQQQHHQQQQQHQHHQQQQQQQQSQQSTYNSSYNLQHQEHRQQNGMRTDVESSAHQTSMKTVVPLRQSSSYERQNVEQIQQVRSINQQQSSTPGSVFNSTHGPLPMSPTPMSPLSSTFVHSRPESVASSDGQSLTVTLKQVQDTAKQWYLPFISRDEAVNILKHQPPGSFLVRDSNSFSDAFGLAVKVASLPPKITPKSNDLQSELVRHYLIEPVTNKGVRLKGFAQEPVFPTLAALIHQHILHAMALPLRLVLPPLIEQGGFSPITADYVGINTPDLSNVQEQNYRSITTTTTISNNNNNNNNNNQGSNTTGQNVSELVNLGGCASGTEESHIAVLSTTDDNTQDSTQTTACPKSASFTLQTSEHYNPSRIGIVSGDSAYNVVYLGSHDVNCNDGHRALKLAIDNVIKQIQTSGRHTECQLQVSSVDGLTLTDTRRKLFVRRNFPAILITYCGLDPKDRTYDYPDDDQRTMTAAKPSCLDAFFKPINDKKHRIFAFIARKSAVDMSSVEGTCYVLCEVQGAPTATVIVKDVLKTLQSGLAK